MRGPSRQRWEGEGLSVTATLTRLATLATLSRGAGEGLLGVIDYSAFSIASALDTSTWLGTCSTLSAFTVPSSTSIE